MPDVGVATDLPAVKLNESGAIDEDIFCLECGYNLRGLVGDPVRCPECGVDNPVGYALMPAGDIRLAMNRLETAPTAMVAASGIITAVFSLWVLPGAAHDWDNMEKLPFVVVLVLPAMIGAYISWLRLLQTCDVDTARRVVVRFHLAALLMAGPTIVWLMYFVVYHELPDRWRTRGAEPMVWLALLLLFACALPFVWGLRIYRETNRIREEVQRATAVRIAREVFRRRLHWSRVRAGLGRR